MEEQEQTPRTAHVFGPVASRRLGQSLGIDPVPTKTCNWNCVYCQLGRTMPVQGERSAFFPSDELVSEVQRVLARQEPGAIDWVTFVGSGETLLHSEFGAMLRGVQGLTDLPVAVITNGSLLSRPEVREEVLPAQAVLPSLDAGTPGLFRRINRPHPGISFQEHLEGLEAFRRRYRGELLLEIMLVRGLNDTEEALEELAGAVKRVRPDGIHLSRPDRPPAEAWVEPTTDEGFLRAVSALGSVARVLHPTESVLRLGDPAVAMEELLAVLARHPLSEAQLQRALGHWNAEDAQDFLRALERSPEVKKAQRHGKSFWVSDTAEFPD